MRWQQRVGAMLLGLAAIAAVAGSASAQAVIDNGRVRLGINPAGHLNVFVPGLGGVGIQDIPSGFEATYPGCLCEGWGAGISGGTFNGLFGGGDEAQGGELGGLTSSSLVSDGTSATATAIISSGGADVLRVVHQYTPVPGDDRLYRVSVTLTNLAGETLGSGDQGIRYRRLMDWDIIFPGTEVVTTNATVAGNIIGFSTNGFASVNPFVGRGSICGVPENTPAVDVGPCDHGGLFDFAFPALGVGQSLSFLTYYGTAPSEASMHAAFGAVGIEAFSTAWCSPSVATQCSGEGGTTFGFGFEGLGAPPVIPPTTVPEPGTWALLASGLLGIAGMARRRRA